MKIQFGHSYNKNLKTTQRLRFYSVAAAYGLAAGLLATLGISAIIMLAEKVASLPMGTFYSVLSLAIFPTQDPTSFNSIGLIFLIHVTTGTLIGALMSVLYLGLLRRRVIGFFKTGYAPIWGLFAGFALWVGLFLPITFGFIIPSLNSHTITSNLTDKASGQIASEQSQLLAIINQTIVSAVAFNMFYGMATFLILRALYDSRMKSKSIPG